MHQEVFFCLSDPVFSLREGKGSGRSPQSNGVQRFVVHGRKNSEFNRKIQKTCRKQRINGEYIGYKPTEEERNPLEGLIQRKEGASDGTFVDAGAAIHLTAAFA